MSVSGSVSVSVRGECGVGMLIGGWEIYRVKRLSSPNVATPEACVSIKESSKEAEKPFITSLFSEAYVQKFPFLPQLSQLIPQSQKVYSMRECIKL